MRWNDIYIAATASWLPGTVSAEQAVADGHYDPEDATKQDLVSVAVADPGENVADMWTRAARCALGRTGYAPADVDLLLCAATFGAGVDGWNAAGYVQRELAAPQSFAVEVRGGSNGGLAATELAASYLLRPGASTAVITAGDLFPMPYFDRWRAERFVFGDGCAAAVLSTKGGFVRLLATASASDPELEALHRGDTPIGPFDPDKKYPIDLRDRARHFMAGMAKEELWQRLAAGSRTVGRQVLDETGIDIGDVDHVVVPHFGRTLITLQCLYPLGLRNLDRTTWEFARRIGHLGPADQFAGLNHLHETGALRSGQLVLMLGVGAGFSWSCALGEVVSI